MLKAGQKIVFRISADEAATATIKVIPELFEYLSVRETKDTFVDADSRRWICFTLPEGGRYQFDAISTEPDAAYEVNLKYYRNDIDGNEVTTIKKGEIVVSNNSYNEADVAIGDTVYVEVTTDKAGETSADIRVSLNRITAKELTLDKEETLTIENGMEQWYTFRVPQNGKYMFKSVVTPNVGTDGTAADTHKFRGAWYQRGMEEKTPSEKFTEIGDYDFYYVRTFTAGQIVTLKVSTDDLAAGEDGAKIKTEAKFTVTKFTAEPFTVEEPADITVLKNETKWYSFTAPDTKAYMFKYNVTQGTLSSDYHREFDDFTHAHLYAACYP